VKKKKIAYGLGVAALAPALMMPNVADCEIQCRTRPEGGIQDCVPQFHWSGQYRCAGTLHAWDQVMNRSLNLHVALRSCRLRYCDNGDSAPMMTDMRIATLARILDLAIW